MTNLHISQAKLNDLKARYAESHRHYHTWAHIEALLGWFTDVSWRLDTPVAVQLAILYHDAIYDPRSKENETESARLMMRELDGDVPISTLDRAETMILATAGHLLPAPAADAGRESDIAWFLDMDLSVLGAPTEIFDVYETSIRKEYGFVSDQRYAEGRFAVLDGFLRRDRIYFTGHFHDRLENPARSNLTRSLDRLQGNLAGGGGKS